MALPAWLALNAQVPAPTSVSVLPLAVHTLGVVDAKETVRPEVEVAVKAAGVVPRFWLPGAMKVMVCAAATTVKEFETGTAATKLALPAWLALTEQVPTLTRVRAVLLTVQIAGVVDANETVRPDVEVAVKVSGVALNIWLPGVAKVIVCAAGAGASPPLPPQAFNTTSAARAHAWRMTCWVECFIASFSEGDFDRSDVNPSEMARLWRLEYCQCSSTLFMFSMRRVKALSTDYNCGRPAWQ